MAVPIRILLVEDNPGDVRLLREFLREASSFSPELTHAGRLDEAQQLLLAESHDVILLDLSLPDAHGMSTVSRALEFAPDVPIIVLTGLNDEAVAVQAVQLGAQDYLVKGQIDSVLLARSIRYAIERKQLDRERNVLLAREQEARSRAEDAVRARDEVLHIVSHDLGNSFSSILINATVVARTLSADAPSIADAVGRVNGIREEVFRMQRLRQDLLDIASIEAGRLSVVRTPLQPHELLASARDRLLPLANEKRLRIRIDAEPELPELDADFDRLLQVLGNLLGNAIKFTPEDQEIVLAAARSDGAVCISVRDPGPGIPPESQARIFERFWKVRTGNFFGAGLGLAIVKGIVEAHGGAVWVESRTGQGSTFSFTIPTSST